jgi:AbiV family abortive infection protein
VSAVKNRNYQLTTALLKHYCDAALINAQNLLNEANLLLQNNHFARTYFLAVAAIEEVGKSVQAFDGMGRNLNDSAVCTRLKLQFENHSQKITSAFIPWLIASPNLNDEIKSFVDTMIDVKLGREPSMYTDIHFDGTRITTPESEVRPEAANNCIRIAEAVLSYTIPYITAKPKITTHTQDEFFAMKPSIFAKMANTEDFWWYYISRMASGDKAIENAVTEYNKKYFSKNIKFKADL